MVLKGHLENALQEELNILCIFDEVDNVNKY